MKSNMRNLINFLEYYENLPAKQVAILFIDVEKAFDNVNWNFMTQLEEMGAGQNFTEIIKIIYSKQMAKIRINGEHTQEIEIHKGTLQGCALSPLLF